MTTDPDCLGIDFGTSNSAAGCLVDGAPVLLALEGSEQTLPTAVFFDFEERRTLFGHAANQALFDGEWGRYMRALKSLLGTPLLHESRSFLGKRLSYADIVARFLAEVKSRAEAQAGRAFPRALSGRPVLFHSADPARNARAAKDLKACYLAAGFDAVEFLPEPVAAARANAHALGPGDIGLVIDIGGGTSDFTLFRSGGAPGAIDVIASHGLRLGGTDFDRMLSLAHVMPHLGRGSAIRHAFGTDTHPAPNALFSDLATWAKIPFLYAPEARRQAADLAAHAAEPAKLARLVKVLGDELGHDLAFAVEAGKISAGEGASSIDLSMLERGLAEPLVPEALTALLMPSADDIAAEALATLDGTGIGQDQVTHLIYVGGSSLLPVIETALSARFPLAAPLRGAALTAIVQGLALATRD